MMIERTLHGEWVAFDTRRSDHPANNSRMSVVPHHTAEVSMLFTPVRSRQMQIPASNSQVAYLDVASLTFLTAKSRLSVWSP